MKEPHILKIAKDVAKGFLHEGNIQKKGIYFNIFRTVEECSCFDAKSLLKIVRLKGALVIFQMCFLMAYRLGETFSLVFYVYAFFA